MYFFKFLHVIIEWCNYLYSSSTDIYLSFSRSRLRVFHDMLSYLLHTNLQRCNALFSSLLICTAIARPLLCRLLIPDITDITFMLTIISLFFSVLLNKKTKEQHFNHITLIAADITTQIFLELFYQIKILYNVDTTKYIIYYIFLNYIYTLYFRCNSVNFS